MVLRYLFYLGALAEAILAAAPASPPSAAELQTAVAGREGRKR